MLGKLLVLGEEEDQQQMKMCVLTLNPLKSKKLIQKDLPIIFVWTQWTIWLILTTKKSQQGVSLKIVKEELICFVRNVKFIFA
jgi:hypothetical protein